MTTPALDTTVELPATVLGVEQEYKWKIEPGDLAADPTLEELERIVPAPIAGRRELAFRHTQSTLYFDDHWRLARDRIALRATVNPGAAKNVSWIGVKQTIAWVDGCRDSLEVNERISPKGITTELRQRRTLPVAYASRLCGGSLKLDAFASVTQHRHKVFYRTADEMLLQLTFDIAEFRALPDGSVVSTRWLEIENNTADLRARYALNRWAHDICDWLGRPASERAKSELAAEMAGWRPNQ